MENQVLESNLKWIKIGLIWNGITLLIAMVFQSYGAWYDGTSFGEALFLFVLIGVIGGIVYAANIYLYTVVRKVCDARNVKFGIILSILSIFSLNIIGSIITLVGYIKLNNSLKLTDQ